MRSGRWVAASVLGWAVLLMGTAACDEKSSSGDAVSGGSSLAAPEPSRFGRRQEPRISGEAASLMRYAHGMAGGGFDHSFDEGRFRFDGAGRSPILTSVAPGAGFSGRRHVIRTGMAIDTDGPVAGYDPRVHRDPHRQLQTSLRYTDGSSIDPTMVPYVVVPSSHKSWLGDFVKVEYRGRQVMAVVADCGPRFGEGSVALAQQLGIPSSGVSGGAADGVTYTFYPDSGRRYSGEGDIKAALLRKSGASATLVADASQ